MTITRDDDRSYDTNDRMLLYGFYEADDFYKFVNVNGHTIGDIGHQLRPSPHSMEIPISDGSGVPLTISASPPSINAGATTQEVTLTATLPEAPDADVTVFITNTDSTILIPAGGTEGEVSFTLTETPFTVETPVRFYAFAPGYLPSNEISIPVVDRDAQADAEGYRVVIVNLADGAWVGKGAKKVKVEVIRVNNIAYPWTSFPYVEVALRDTTTGSPDMYVLQATNLIEKDGDIVFGRAIGGQTRVNWDNNVITCDESGDKFREDSQKSSNHIIILSYHNPENPDQKTLDTMFLIAYN